VSLKVLHLVSNWKLTGPVAPALELAGALLQRGHEVHAAVGRAVEPTNYAGEHARRQGLRLVGDLTLSKHFRFLDNVRDVKRLRKMVVEDGYDLLHVHGTNDHLLASAVRRNLPSGGLVRSFYGGMLERLRRRDRLLSGRAADGLIVPSRAEQAWAHAIRPDLAPERVLRLPGAVDLERFDPDRVAGSARSAGPFRLGVVARVQTHRRWEDILAAFSALIDRGLDLELVVVGRGTHYERLLETPVQAMGIADRVELTGYLNGDDYVRRLVTLDAAVYLVPGSDGTCRAARELMALGVPLVVSRQGMLPELVEMGRSGLLLDGDGPEPLVDAVTRLVRNPALRERTGRAARARAERDFNLARYAEQVEALYERVLGR